MFSPKMLESNLRNIHYFSIFSIRVLSPVALPLRFDEEEEEEEGGGASRSGKLDRARSRLYRSHILQVNMRWKALAEIYKMHSFATFSKLK